MAKYEFTILVPKDRNDAVKTVKKYLDDVKARVSKEEDWGVKSLAYMINKQSEALYQYFELEMDPESAKKLESVLKLDDVVMRYLLIRK